MVERQEGKRPFSDKKELVIQAYEDALAGEYEVSEVELNINKPYRLIDGRYFQTAIDEIKVRTGDEIPHYMMSLDDRPTSHTPSYKRRPNAALLYIFADNKKENEPFQSFADIGKLYGVTQEQIRMDMENHVEDIYEIAYPLTKARYPKKSFTTRRPIPLAGRILKMSSSSTKDILDLIRNGSSTKELTDRFGSRIVDRARRTLNSWGLEEPERVNRNVKSVIEKIKDPTTTLDELRVLMGEINQQRIIHTYKDVFMPITQIQFKAWGNKDLRRGKVAAEYLKEAGLPVYEIQHQQVNNGKKKGGYYRGTLRRLEREAVELLKEHSEEIGTSVIQVAGEIVENIPNTNELFGSKKGNYVYVPISQVSQILAYPNIPLFKTKDNRYYTGRDYAHLLDES